MSDTVAVLSARTARALAAGDLATASALLQRMVDHEGESLSVLQLRFRLERQRGDASGALSSARNAVDRFPDALPAHHMAVQAAIAAELWNEADEAVRVARTRFPEDLRLLELGVLVDRKAGRTEEALSGMRLLAARSDRPARWLAEIGKLLTASFQAEAGLEALKAAVESGADEAPLRVHLATAAERAGHLDEATRFWTAVGEAEPTRRKAAEAALKRIAHRREPVARTAEVGDLDALCAFQVSGARTRAAAVATRVGDVTGWREPASRQAVLFFGSIGPMMGATRARVPSPVTVRRINGLSFADPRRQLTLGGIPTLGETYASTLAGLRRLLEAWDVTETYAVGLSAGGYPALRYGIDLGVRRILLMSPGLRAPEGSESPLAVRLTRELGDMAMDARSLIEERGAQTPIIVAYGADNPQDRWQVAHLAGLANVDMRPVTGSASHYVGGDALESTLYDMLIDRPPAGATAAAAGGPKRRRKGGAGARGSAKTPRAR